MADLGLQGAFGNAGMAAAIRQRIADRLAQTQQRFNNDVTQQKLDLLKQEAGVRLGGEIEGQIQSAANRVIASHDVNDPLAPEEVRVLSLAGYGPAFVKETTPTLPSTSVTGATTLPSQPNPAGDVAPAQPAQIVGRLTKIVNPGSAGGPVFRGSAAQRQVAEQRDLIRGTLRKLDPNSPMGQALNYRLLTGDNAPSGAFTKPDKSTVQSKTVMVNGRRILANFDPAKGTYTDQTGRPLSNVQPVETDTSAGDRARLDRSFTANLSQLNAMRKPVSDLQQRMGRLVEAVNQETPQADALVAPELLTVMAGGMGSGLRMNEAEIARIVGGRSNFESIKAALNKWQTDPTKALSITPAQRQQIRDLIQSVASKSEQAMALMNQAEQDLIDAPDVHSQREILANLRKQIDAIHAAPTGASPSPDLSGYRLQPGQGVKFDSGPFKGQTWTIGRDGKPVQVP